jgi:hypothetical protein
MITIRIHHAAGRAVQLRYADGLLVGDTDGDGEPDVGVALDGARLTAADLIL